MNREQAKILLQRYRMGLCTPEEEAVIGQWYDTMAASGEWSWTEEERRAFEEPLRAGIWQAMNEPAGIGDEDVRGRLAGMGEANRVGSFVEKETIIRRFSLPRVAAAILLCVAAGTYFFVHSRPHQEIVEQGTGKQFSKDVLPGGDKAVLTLADGSDMVLDSAKNGLVVRQGNTSITKPENGKLTYQPVAGTALPTVVSYNKLTTPRGGQYQLVLPDGSKVWLNAASSIRYPTVFTGKERRVEISGEVYFEVARAGMGNASGINGVKEAGSTAGKNDHGNTPFIVSIAAPSGMPGAGGEVEVLGTHFDVNAYGDENMVKTTLLEGSVKLVKDGAGILLKPGQQAGYGMTGGPALRKDADVDEVVAWKNGIFQFNEASIETVMRQVERWYDIEVSYEGKIPSGHFSGTVDRNANISQILKILELSEVHFRIEGRRIVILP
jgi:transmembrane sensor